MSNVYRVAVVLKEEIDGEVLQKALERSFLILMSLKSTIKMGIFWYYFEENKSPLPKVVEEYTYPCLFINPHKTIIICSDCHIIKTG